MATVYPPKEKHRAALHEVERCKTRIREEQEALERALKRAFPSGRDCMCRHGDQEFRVVSLGEARYFDQTVKVLNTKTGKETWRYFRSLTALF